MKRSVLKMALCVTTISVLVGGIVSAAEKSATIGQKLTKDDKMMMKNGAMKNMDKYMGSKEAMMKRLPKAMMSAQMERVAAGKKLFSSTDLGANGQSCNSCHPGGGTTGGTVKTPMKSELTGKAYELPVPSLVGAAATFPKFKVPNDRVVTVQEMSNNCIMMFMGARPLPLESKQSKDLYAYLVSLSKGEVVDAGKMPAMMKKMMGGGH